MESHDLLLAASQAQQLGRLKMASAYLLLLHARLVGLGKRFDRARITSMTRTCENDDDDPCDENDGNEESHIENADQEDGDDEQEGRVKTEPENGPETASRIQQTRARKHTEEATLDDTPHPTTPMPAAALFSSPTPTTKATAQRRKSGRPGSDTGGRQDNLAATTTPTTATATAATPKTKAARQLAQMLPSHIEMDQAMMEHLARAAAELHAARCRTGSSNSHSHHAKLSGTTEATAHDFLASAATNLYPASHTKNDTASITLSSGAGATGCLTSGGIAWTDAEKAQLQAALSSGQQDPRALAAMTGRTEQQVKVYLRNQTERKRVQADLEQLPQWEQAQTDEGAAAAARAAGTTLAVTAATAAAKTPTMTSPPTGANQKIMDNVAVTGDAAVASATCLTTPKRKGGRGRKPTTAPMNTVPNAICDARTLLQGGVLPKGG